MGHLVDHVEKRVLVIQFVEYGIVRSFAEAESHFSRTAKIDLLLEMVGNVAFEKIVHELFLVVVVHVSSARRESKWTDSADEELPIEIVHGILLEEVLVDELRGEFWLGRET